MVFGRYLFNEGKQTRPNALNTTLNNVTTQNQVATLEATVIVSPTLLNTARFGFTRVNHSDLTEGILPQLNDPAFALVPGLPVGSINITGLASPGVSGPNLRPFNTFQWSDTVTHTGSGHTLKAGVDIKRFQSNQVGGGSGRVFGRYRFSSLQDFLIGRPRSFEWDVPGHTALDTFYWRQSLFGFFVQDDWRLKSNLTVNLGLRYEFITVPKEKEGRSNALLDLMDTDLVQGPFFRNPSLKSFAPRVGLAWDPFGNGKTAVRAGFGIFYDQFVALHALDSPNPPFGLSKLVNNPGFKKVTVEEINDTGGTGTLTLNSVFFNLDQPTKFRWSLNIQRELNAGTVMNMSYTGAHGYHQFRATDEANTALPQILPDGRKFWPANSPRRNPAWGNIRIRNTNGDHIYHALQLGLNRRWAQGLGVQVSYTFSKILDNGIIEESRDFLNNTPVADPDDPAFDRGVSTIDIKHNFTLNSTYTLPGRNLSGAAGKVLGGWELSGILRFASGSSFTPILGFDRARKIERSGGGGQRPDLATGASNNPVLGTPDQWFDPTAFSLPEAGFFGNLGRSTIIGPGFANFDLSLVKNTAIGEGKNLQFRAEAFNLTNHPNFQVPESNEVFDSAGPVLSAGRITNTKTTSRQLQFGLKFIF